MKKENFIKMVEHLVKTFVILNHDKYKSFNDMKKWLHSYFKNLAWDKEYTSLIKHSVISYIYYCELNWVDYQNIKEFVK